MRAIVFGVEDEREHLPVRRRDHLFAFDHVASLPEPPSEGFPPIGVLQDTRVGRKHSDGLQTLGSLSPRLAASWQHAA